MSSTRRQIVSRDWTTDDAGSDMAEVLTRLYGVATDEETAVLDRLTLRAGLAWHCDCGWHNSERVLECEDCGQPRRTRSDDDSSATARTRSRMREG